MVHSVRQTGQHISNCPVKALSDGDAAVGNKGCEVVQFGCRLVEVFDRNDVRITEAYHVRKN